MAERPPSLIHGLQHTFRNVKALARFQAGLKVTAHFGNHLLQHGSWLRRDARQISVQIEQAQGHP
ncbi:hypothetical protein D3C76_1710770 [compost metagenome]